MIIVPRRSVNVLPVRPAFETILTYRLALRVRGNRQTVNQFGWIHMRTSNQIVGRTGTVWLN